MKMSWVIILAVVTFLAYINVYQNVFLSDDLEGILQNKNIGNVGMALSSGQPVHIINSLVYNLFGAKEPYFHFVNVIIHIANVFLVYLLVSLIANRKLAFFTAFLFALHPVHTEAVTWISGKPYVLYSFFLLISLILFILYSNKKRLFLLAFSLLGYVLGLLTMEKAIMFPFLIVLYLVCFKNFKRDWKITISYFAITFMYGLTLIWRIPQRIAAINPSYAGEVVTHNPILQTSIAVSSYLELFLAPIRLTFYHDTSMLGNSVMTIMIMIAAVFLLLTIILFKKNRLLFFALSFFVIAISPTLIPISVGWVVAERYFYLGSAGLCIFLAYLILKFKKMSYGLLAVILIIFFGLTIKRNEDWRNEDKLWPATVKYSYGVPVAHNNMGDYYARRGDYSNAIKEFSLAIDFRRGLYPEAIHNLGNTYRQLGDLEKAEALYLKAIELKPDQIESYMQLSDLYKSKKDLTKAEEYIQKASKISKPMH